MKVHRMILLGWDFWLTAKRVAQGVRQVTRKPLARLFSFKVSDVIRSMKVPKSNQERPEITFDALFLALTEKRVLIFEKLPCAKFSKHNKIMELTPADLIWVSP